MTVTFDQAQAAVKIVEGTLESMLGKSLAGIESLAVAWDDAGELCVRVEAQNEVADRVRNKLGDSQDGVAVVVSPVKARTVHTEAVSGSRKEAISALRR